MSYEVYKFISFLTDSVRNSSFFSWEFLCSFSCLIFSSMLYWESISDGLIAGGSSMMAFFFSGTRLFRLLIPDILPLAPTQEGITEDYVESRLLMDSISRNQPSSVYKKNFRERLYEWFINTPQCKLFALVILMGSSQI